MSPLFVALLVAVAGVEPSVAASGHEQDRDPTPAVASPLAVHTDAVEHDAVVLGLELRVGADWTHWTIEIDDGPSDGTVEVRLTDASQTHTRVLTLMSDTVDARSRELASALALILEQLPQEPTAPTATTPEDSTTPPPSRSLSGWIGVGPRGAINPSTDLDPDVGVSLAGGTWLLREHLQAIGSVEWSGWSEDDLRLEAVRFGTAAAGGTALAKDRLWTGAGVSVRAQWSRASAATTATGWWANPAVMAVLQYRGRVLIAGTWLGFDLLLPPLRAHDGRTVMRWAPLRPMATVHIGLRIPPRRRPKQDS